MAGDPLERRAMEVIRLAHAAFPDNLAMAYQTAAQAIAEGGWERSRDAIKGHRTFGQTVPGGGLKDYPSDKADVLDHKRLWYDNAKRPGIKQVAGQQDISTPEGIRKAVRAISQAMVKYKYNTVNPKYADKVLQLHDMLKPYWDRYLATNPAPSFELTTAVLPASDAKRPPVETYHDNAKARRAAARGLDLYADNRRTFERHHVGELAELDSYLRLKHNGATPYRSILSVDAQGHKTLNVGALQQNLGIKMQDGQFGDDTRANATRAIAAIASFRPMQARPQGM